MDFIHDKVEMSDFLTEDFDFLVFDLDDIIENVGIIDEEEDDEEAKLLCYVS